jgi:hypothetical protein
MMANCIFDKKNYFMKIFALHFFLICLMVVNIGKVSAQVNSDSTETPTKQNIGSFPKSLSFSKGSIQVNGFYRFFATYQKQNLAYPLSSAVGDTVLPRWLFIGDDSQLPNLLLNVSGRLQGGSSWGFDLRMFQFLNGSVGTSYGKQVADSLRPDVQYPRGGLALGGSLGTMLGVNLYGNFNTKKGQWAVKIGGIQWVSISDLTMGAFRGYNRFILFERNPWDPVGKGVTSRYQQYFDQGSIDQDARWGNRAFQGLVIEGTALPHNLSCLALIGKTELNGGFSTTPDFSYGGKIKKNGKGKNFISLNTINRFSYTDSLAKASYGFNVITTEFQYSIGDYAIKGEVGAGNYFSPLHSEGWGEQFQLKASTSEKGRFGVFEVHAFRISPKIVNNNAVYWNTAVSEYTVNSIPAGSIGSSAVLQPFGSSMVRVGQMTNNRQGLNLNYQLVKKKLKVSAGIGSSAEIKPAAAVITVGHPVNQFTRSRFWRWTFPSGIGPYNRYSHLYRDVYETVKLSDDSSGVVVNKKFFNSMEMQLKYKYELFGRECYLFALLQANSSSPKWSPVTVFNEKAYVRQYASEAEAYFKISSTVMVSLYGGLERTIGNYLTEINEETRRPLNQTGRGIGLGCDIDLGRNARLYVRHRWYDFRDTSFALDHFNGHELVVELKAFF